MDWPRKSPQMNDKDRKIFQYDTRSNTIVKLCTSNLDQTIWEASYSEDLLQWLEKEPSDCSSQRGQTIAILADRAEDTNPGGAHNPALLRYLPFCEKNFDMILRKLYVHGSIVRTVNRGYPIFSRTLLKLGTLLEPAIVYNCRTSHEWPGDLALSMTYFPLRRVTYGVLYGCDAEIKEAILARLHNSEDAACHPLLLIGIFTELERKRQLNLVRDGLDALHSTILNLSRPAGDVGSMGVDRELSGTHAIDPWLDIHHLKNSLESWKEQLAKIAEHIDELSENWFNFLPSDSDNEGAEKCQVREVGKRIKERILEIVCDYDAKIRECVMIMEGMNLATQLAHARANIEIAAAAKTDSSQMKTIALVTMVFLPATFVASLFSMTFFDWNPPEGRHISPEIWIYVIIAVGLTLLVIGLWYTIVRRTTQDKSIRNMAV
ncbi:hypothetical protein EV127DRAFT_506397 [Xylaria flabelliformis]|nr:hypothetical protein EV127DRAFT_506397 [Xylaria flabelliformis]